MRRREFIGLAGAVVAWPSAGAGQQANRARVLGVLMHTDESHGQAITSALRVALRDIGWIKGRELQRVERFGAGKIERVQAYAGELVALRLDVIFVFASAQLAAVSRKTQTIPIVFVGASDPVGAGYVESFARPGGNITGFTLFEPSLAGKWMESLKEIAPTIERVAIVVNPDTALLRGKFYLEAFETGATTLGVKPITAFVRSISDVESAIAELGRGPEGALIIAPETFTDEHIELFVALTARYRLPAIYGNRVFSMIGGLMSYGPDSLDLVRRAAVYVSRILRGEKPADLPVQVPTKYELVVNLKTAKALGLTIPPSLLVRADEVIE